ncbi:hypothetical protein QQP08_016013 [Theobroma cacao]|nr:hypothetical protein QQP08_016013 [Theobroma cacao]
MTTGNQQQNKIKICNFLLQCPSTVLSLPAVRLCKSCRVHYALLDNNREFSLVRDCCFAFDFLWSTVSVYSAAFSSTMQLSSSLFIVNICYVQLDSSAICNSPAGPVSFILLTK